MSSSTKTRRETTALSSNKIRARVPLGLTVVTLAFNCCFPSRPAVRRPSSRDIRNRVPVYGRRTNIGRRDSVFVSYFLLYTFLHFRRRRSRRLMAFRCPILLIFYCARRPFDLCATRPAEYIYYINTMSVYNLLF